MPFATGLLADMGARSRSRSDLPRHLRRRAVPPQRHERPILGAGRHLQQPQPRQTERCSSTSRTRRANDGYRELVATADVLIENNRPGVMTARASTTPPSARSSRT
ncbi:MAG: hypothetical protein U0531_05125 [Dehalococcoidia bacterium]